MSKIINFDCNEDLIKHINSLSGKVLLGTGSEGSVYKGKDNKNVYKFIEYSDYSRADIDKIITEEDVNIPSYIFPKELYVVDGNLKGYKSALLSKDYFSTINTLELDNIVDFDFIKFQKAYKVMLKDTIELSKHNILIGDLAYNIIFDGNKLAAIDTCDYKKVDYNTTERNINLYNHAIESIFDFWFQDEYEFGTNFTIKDNNIRQFVLDVINKLPSDLKKEIKHKYKKK